MSAGSFALLVVLILLLVAAVPVRSAIRAKSFFATDVGLVLLPTPAFIACLIAFNKPAQTGWALIGYPFLVLAASVAALFVRIYVLPKVGLAPKLGSWVTVVLAVLAAATFGVFVSPWYE